MPEPVYILDGKVEAGFAALFADSAVAAAMAIYKGQDTATRGHPSVTVYSQCGPEHPMDTGNHFVDVEISVRTPIDVSGETDAVLEHQANVGLVFDLVRDEDLPELLTEAVEEFHCYQVVQAQPGHGVEGNHYLETLKLRLYACPSDLV